MTAEHLSQPTSSSIPQYFQTMSPIPPPSEPSAPPSEPSPTTTTRPTPTPHPPKPLLRLELRDLSHPATKLFLSNFDAATDFHHLFNTVYRLLYDTSSKATPTATPTFTASKPTPPPPEVRSITLVLRPMDGVAYTTGLDLDNAHKEIHFSLSYIESRSRSLPSPSTSTTSPSPPAATPSSVPLTLSPHAASSALRHELLGVICHELVHTIQHNAHSTAPGGLIEGIADFVRLRANLSPPHWKRDASGAWDAGYERTAYFLEYLEQRFGAGSVRRINAELGRGRYEEGRFWRGLFGEGVEGLWRAYGEGVGKGDGFTGADDSAKIFREQLEQLEQLRAALASEQKSLDALKEELRKRCIERGMGLEPRQEEAREDGVGHDG